MASAVAFGLRARRGFTVSGASIVPASGETVSELAVATSDGSELAVRELVMPGVGVPKLSAPAAELPVVALAAPDPVATVVAVSLPVERPPAGRPLVLDAAPPVGLLATGPPVVAAVLARPAVVLVGVASVELRTSVAAEGTVASGRLAGTSAPRR
ncbi:hypothetical protein NKG94_40995 [Micromonospora sp. M12]